MDKRDEKRKVLFICTHNSARSHMAEGFLNNLYGDRYAAWSAGTEPSTVSPYAIKAMAEIGIDISAHRSKSVDEFLDKALDYVVTVCDHAKETCPFFPGGKHSLHQGFEDPSSAEGSEEEKLAVFRRVRDEIRTWVEKTFSANTAGIWKHRKDLPDFSELRNEWDRPLFRNFFAICEEVEKQTAEYPPAIQMAQRCNDHSGINRHG
jgi:arsenate reductase